MSEFITKDHATLGLAIVGCVLGVINSWHQFNKDRLVLKVIPKMVLFYNNAGDETKTIGIETINQSIFPVTIDEVGFSMGSIKKNGRMAIVSPILMDGKPWPRRLEPRESFTAYTGPGIFSDDNFKIIKKAYARTACGRTFYGTSQILKEILK